MSDYSCVYLVKEREFTKTNENIIKVGYSNQEHLKRFKQYPKDSILLCQVFTENGKLCESKILDEFKIQFKHRKDIGNEYFEGDYNLMRKLIIEIVDKVESDNKNFNKDIINELENKIKELEELQKKLNQEQQAHKETKEELKADVNKDLQKEVDLLKEENNKLKIKENEKAKDITELKRLLNEHQKYKIYYDKMHLNADNFQEFIDRFYISSNLRSNRIKCSVIYDKYISETKKTISKQTFYGRIENLGFSKVIVNGERCFSNILAKV